MSPHFVGRSAIELTHCHSGGTSNYRKPGLCFLNAQEDLSPDSTQALCTGLYALCE